MTSVNYRQSTTISSITAATYDVSDRTRFVTFQGRYGNSHKLIMSVAVNYLSSTFGASNKGNIKPSSTTFSLISFESNPISHGSIMGNGFTLKHFDLINTINVDKALGLSSSVLFSFSKNRTLDFSKGTRFGNSSAESSNLLIRYKKSNYEAVSTIVRWDNITNVDIRVDTPTDTDWTFEEPDIIVHPRYEVYVIVNNIVVTHNGDLMEHHFGFSMSRQIDSFSWQLTMSVDESFYERVKRSGKVMEVINVRINNEYFDFVVTSSSKTGSISGFQYSIRAESVISSLRAPNIKVSSYTEPTTKTASQIVLSLLQPYGFTVEWNLIDWVIPSNIFSFNNKTPIGAVMDIINSVGAIMYNDSNNVIRVESRYRVNPWDWEGDVSLNRKLFEAQIFNADDSDVVVNDSDSVIVASEYNDTSVRAVINGTSGSDPLDDVLSKYAGTIESLTERGRIELSKSSTIMECQYTTFVGDTGIIRPGELVEIESITGSTYRVYVTGVSVSQGSIGAGLNQSFSCHRRV